MGYSPAIVYPDTEALQPVLRNSPPLRHIRTNPINGTRNQSATEMVTSFGKAGTGYCAVIAGQTTVTTAPLRQCDRGIFTGYSVSGHRSVTAGPAKSASAAPYKNESHKWDGSNSAGHYLVHLHHGAYLPSHVHVKMSLTLCVSRLEPSLKKTDTHSVYQPVGRSLYREE